MDIHYNAFISYRHHPEDIRVATEIHRALERYHIPKAVRKNLKGSLRLFRDKDELPITSNLSDDIFRALQNSDFLIVICSTHTKESIWVQREIETFLQTHTYDKVLTVLVDGEPYDTIPEILQYREEKDPVTGEIKRIPIEPLSCDWRVGKKAAYREELPRLAAALLHCGYDELRQRQRQYKMRRLITVFSAALVASVSLMAYFLYTSIIIQQANEELHAANEEISRANAEIQAANVQIQENLNQALRNQSQYLSSAALERFAAGDRLTAISLAMAALPSADNPRPYVPAAEQILSEALGIYESTQSLTAAGILDCGALIREFAVSKDGTILYCIDRNNRITSWDTQTYRQIASVNLVNTAYRWMDVIGENLVIQMLPDYGTDLPDLSCYSPKGELLWSVDSCVDYAMLGEDTLVTLSHIYGFSSATLEFRNPLTGEKCREDISFPVASSLTARGFFHDSHEEGQPIPLSFSEWTSAYVYLVNPETGETHIIDPATCFDAEKASSISVKTAAVTQQGDLVVMVSDGSGSYNGEFSNMTTTSPATAHILCFSGDDMTLLWRQTITTYSYSLVQTLQSIPGSNNILCQKDNAFYVLDGATGQILSHSDTLADVLSVYVQEDRAYGVQEDGCYYVYYFNENRCSALRLMDANIYQAEVADAYFTLVTDSTHVTVYRTSQKTEWTPYKIDRKGYSRWERTFGDRLAFMASEGNLYMFDMTSDSILWMAETGNGYGIKPLGFSQDGAWLYTQDGSNVMAFDAATGQMHTVEIPQIVNGLDARSCGYWHMAADRFYYLLRIENERELVDLYLAVMDLTSFETQTYLFIQDVEESLWSAGNKSGTAVAGKDYAWLWDAGTLYEFKLSSGTFRPILQDLAEYPLCTYHEAENLLSVGVGNDLIFFTPGGEEVRRVSLGEQKAVSVRFYKDELLILDSERQLNRFDENGTRRSQTDLHVYTSFYNNAVPSGGEQLDIKWNFTENGELILGVFGLCNVIDCNEWGVRAYVLNYKAFDSDSNRLICDASSVLGYFPLYSTEEVVSIAVDQLNGYELPEEKKTYYGIE